MRPDHHNALKLVILGDGIAQPLPRDHVKAPEELEPLPGALEAVARLNQAGWHTVVATNQPGIGRGLLDMASLNAIHLPGQAADGRAAARRAAFFCPTRPRKVAIAASRCRA